ncbi:cation:proton antiporter [Permianibacter sp. IMCC34836]|uniref:cation:proton antiporter n=1 Tax=Permianibacter fluminis TaxID=2738515 RepID=UPI00155480AC|nr:cation:proton antiporter [Permianibacter fluminis]NQD39017.1 cation:proton antiporter [Permianibacter fluminis]
MPALSSELIYLSLILGLLILPRALQRFRIPAPLTCLLFGIGATFATVEFSQDKTIALLAVLGISSLFLFAGLEIELTELRKGWRPLLGNVVTYAVILAVVVDLLVRFAGFSWPLASLIALALFTPSTGFILDSLARLGLSEQECFWVSSKAIAIELLALLLLFVVLQSESVSTLLWSSSALVAIILGLPLLFMLLGRLVVPHAPGSEFSLLVMVGLLAAYITKALGVYYLVGAFLAGFVARLLRKRMPALASNENLHAVRLFASFFVPFYFFHAGLTIPTEALSVKALLFGILLAVVVIPLRIGVLWLQRRLTFRDEDRRISLRIAVTLTPTLVFTLVLANIAASRFGLAADYFGALVVYAGITTALPSFVFPRAVNFDLMEMETSMPPTPLPGVSIDPITGEPLQMKEVSGEKS